MILNLGSIVEGDVIYIPFHTFAAAGNSVTLTGLAVTDIEIYKNGSVTQRASDAGYALLDTDGIDFDSTTGLHGFSVNTGDNTDAGFFAAGNTYWVAVSAVTVDSQTVNFWAAVFSLVSDYASLQDIENAVLDADMTDHQAQGSLGQAIGDPVADTETLYNAVITDAGAVLTDIDKTGCTLSATGSAALTESYAADGAAPTLNQMLYQIWAALSEFSIAGTTITCKKLDGSTTAMTFTLDDSASPTSRTRAS